MRAALVAVLVVVAPPSALVAQQPAAAEEPATRLEAFTAQDGVVLIHGTARIGAVRGEPGWLVALSTKECTNASSGERVYGLAVELRKVEGRDLVRTSYVDLEEIPSLLAGLEYMAKVDKPATSLDRLEVSYRTKGALFVTLYGTSSGVKVALSTGVADPATAELEFADFSRFRQLLQSAYESLKSIRVGAEE
jgi:hypothetical protein